MSILPIFTYPDPRLRIKAKRVEKFGKVIQKSLQDMVETMYEATGVGLAAPQLGFDIRAIVIDISAQEEGAPGLIKLLNPEIVSADGEQIGEEGCLSIPGFVSMVKRKESVKVIGFNEKGEPYRIEVSGLLARVLQHEIDHLDGVLFIDRLSRLKRGLFKKKIDRVYGKESYAAF